MNEIHSFSNWGRNPRLDKAIRRVIQRCRYVKKDLEATMEYELCQDVVHIETNRRKNEKGGYGYGR